LDEDDREFYEESNFYVFRIKPEVRKIINEQEDEDNPRYIYWLNEDNDELVTIKNFSDLLDSVELYLTLIDSDGGSYQVSENETTLVIITTLNWNHDCE